MLAGVAVPELVAERVQPHLEAIAARFNPASPSDVELHGSPMLRGSDGWRRHSRADRTKAILDALQTIHTFRLRTFVAAIHKANASPRSPVEVAFEQLSSRFDQFLRRLYLANNTQRGLIVFDKSAEETAIQALTLEFQRLGHSWGRLRNQADVPVFVDSRATRLIQLADLIAYAAFRKFERNDDRFWKVVEPTLDEEGGVVHGLYTGPRSSTTP